MAGTIVSKFLKAKSGGDVTRSVLVHFTNATNGKLTLESKDVSGKWLTSPPSIIQPNAHVDFKSGTSLKSATVKGEVKYRADGGDDVTLKWGNPAIGYNWYEQWHSSGVRLQRDGEGKGSYAEINYKLEKT
ncbi:hypothetical protein MMC19_005924 [Ptychographa xylographoides]|nr:hypothetical protein [Ptychographa xylographoides]